MSEIEVTYDGAYNVVVECTECGTERGGSVVPNTTLAPSRTLYEHCDNCGGHRDHEPVREAERGEYDGHLICDDCDQQFSNTMDVDLHDCPADSDDSDDEDDPAIATDGGQEITEHVDDATIEDAIAQHDDPEHEDALTVNEVRDLLANLQASIDRSWSEVCDSIERGEFTVVAQRDDILLIDTGKHRAYDDDTEVFAEHPDEVDPIAVDVVESIHHRLASEINSERQWPATYPLVVRFPADGEAGQQLVEAVVNGLQRRGLSPGQAWAYYGVEIKGESRNSWGKRKGDHDHKNVCDALEKAKKQLH